MAEKRQSKLQWKLNLWIGFALMLVLFVCVNGLAFKHYYRKNVLIASDYTKVSQQTIQLLKSLSEPLTIIDYTNRNSDPAAALIADDVSSLLDEYAYYGRKGNGKVTIQHVDTYANFEQAKKIANEYKLAAEENVLILAYKGQHKILNYYDLAGVTLVDEAPHLQSFKAEDAITSAIQSLVQEHKSKVYFLTGHGEYDPASPASDGNGYSIIAAYLERQNSMVEKLNLSETPEIPADADLLVIAGPRVRYSDYEIGVLQNYLQRANEKGARLVLMLDPDTDSGLENLAADYGVTFQNDMVMARFATLGQTKIEPNAIASIYPDHPAMAWLKSGHIDVNLGPARSLGIDVNAEKGRGATILSLARTSTMFWGKMDFKGQNLDFDPARDISGPLNLAVLVDTASVSGGQVQLKGLKMILIGSGQFLVNQMISPEQVDFFINMTNWLMEGGKPLGIAPKQPKDFSVVLSPKQMNTLIGILGAFPLLGILAALVLRWKRK